MKTLLLIAAIALASCSTTSTSDKSRAGPMGCANPLQTASPTSNC